MTSKELTELRRYATRLYRLNKYALGMHTSNSMTSFRIQYTTSDRAYTIVYTTTHVEDLAVAKRSLENAFSKLKQDIDAASGPRY